jgi:hypothetical protein
MTVGQPSTDAVTWRRTGRPGTETTGQSARSSTRATGRLAV